MISSPPLPSDAKIAVIDGLNIAFQRPGYREGAFADLHSCMRFFEKVGVQPVTILDRREESENFLYGLPEREQDWIWIVDQGLADPVVLEVATLVPGAVVVSGGEDYAQYQTKYALLVFDPLRMMVFDWRNGVGSGELSFRPVAEKRRDQALITRSLLREFLTVVSVCIATGNAQSGVAFCNRIELQLEALGGSEEPSVRAVIGLSRAILACCEGKRLGIIQRVRLQFLIRKVATRAVGTLAIGMNNTPLQSLLTRTNGRSVRQARVLTRMASQLAANLS